MGRHRPASADRQSPDQEGIDAGTLAVLQRYSAGKVSAREAAASLGRDATEHDVFAGIVAAKLPSPSPPAEQLAAEVAALRALYGR